MNDQIFVTVVLSIEAGITAGLWLAIRQAVQEMEQ